jgi:hypothetical protein
VLLAGGVIAGAIMMLALASRSRAPPPTAAMFVTKPDCDSVRPTPPGPAAMLPRFLRARGFVTPRALLRDAILTHPTMSEGLNILLAGVPTKGSRVPS